MNPQRFQELTAHYIDEFEMINSGRQLEYYKWQIAKKFRPAMEEALSASDGDFSRKLYDVKKLTANLIDSYTQPFNGLVNFAKQEPGTVRDMFRELFAVAEAGVKEKEDAIFRFMDRSLALRDKYYPESYLYSDDLHSVTGYLFLYDPDHNYLYKASHCREFADCVEFYDDWGSGKNTKLDVFFRMCDECIEAINSDPALLKTAESRYDIDREGMHPDTAKHILLFDMIYCCSTYNLFKGINYVVPRSKERQLMQERKEKARELKEDLDAATAKAEELDNVLAVLNETIKAGQTVHHTAYGSGTIAAVNDGRFTIHFDRVGDKELGIKVSIINGLITIDGLDLTEEQIATLKNENKIRSAVSYAEKVISPYWEYLD